MNKKYIEKRTGTNYNAIQKYFGLHPLVIRVMANRGISDFNDIDLFLNGTVKDIRNDDIENIPTGAAIIVNAINNRLKIRIINDYDVDGICSGFILLDGLLALGANADIYTPERTIDGYGMSKDMVENAYNEGVNVILTCDNGISAFEACKRAKELGMTVVITDHHDIPDDMVEADAIINPKLGTTGYEFLCGAGVAYKFLDYINMYYYGNALDMLYYLQFVALATVCDVVPLREDNRIFVKEGFNNISNYGIKALMKENNIDKMDVYGAGFLVGPCINATGRIAYAKTALKLFFADRDEATRMAENLVLINKKRQEMTAEAVKKAIEAYDESQKVIIIHLEDCHESLAGIVAGRVREKYYKPTIIFTGEGDVLKGSARSVEEYHMLNKIKEHKDLLLKFGGHPMAAGLSIKKENFKEFVQKMNDSCEESPFVETVYIDAVADPSVITMDVIAALDILAPFGTGNPSPLFGAKGVVLNPRLIGKKENTLKFVFRDNSGTVEGIKFSSGEEELSLLTESPRRSVIYKMDVNNYMGNSVPQMKVVDIL